ncbi:hypothetical protein ABTZ57_43540, partial [Streptomyces sp. NPDC094048]|uniref:hypothetical protein n=1 Tax=Streptomyces sp. NPDC094048 TaxID=3155207 RepID=UPI003316B362
MVHIWSIKAIISAVRPKLRWTTTLWWEITSGTPALCADFERLVDRGDHVVALVPDMAHGDAPELRRGGAAGRGYAGAGAGAAGGATPPRGPPTGPGGWPRPQG